MKVQPIRRRHFSTIPTFPDGLRTTLPPMGWKLIPLIPFCIFYRSSKRESRVQHSSSTYRLATVLVALLFGLGWGVPVVQAACAPSGSPSPEQCDGLAQHCDGGESASVVCFLHHATGEARAVPLPTPDQHPTGGAGSEAAARSQPSPRASTSLCLSLRRVVRRASRLHARVRVWLE